MEKGILTKQMEARLASLLDEWVKLNPALEAIDGIVFRIAITAIDNKYGELIPEPYKTQIREGLESILIEEDIEKALAAALKLIDELVDVPFLDDETEAMMFTGLLHLITSLLLKK